MYRATKWLRGYDTHFSMSQVRLGSALYKLRKQKGLLEANPPSRFNVISRTNKSPAERKSNSNRSPLKPTSWYHEKYGVITALISDLVRMFPQDKLCESSLSRVRLKKQEKHKGWGLFEKDDKVSPYYKDLMERGA